MGITSSQIEKLQAEGWTVESKSPLELRHDDTGSVATGLAATIVARALDPTQKAVTLRPQEELVLLHMKVNRIMDRGDEKNRKTSDHDYHREYDLIFSDEHSVRIRELLSELGYSLDYWSDGSYEDDVRAFMNALNSKMRDMKEEGALD